MDSLAAEPQGKPKNTGVGSLSLLQKIFPTQESNWGLLHYRCILYQLNCEGKPRIVNITFAAQSWPLLAFPSILLAYQQQALCI